MRVHVVIAASLSAPLLLGAQKTTPHDEADLRVPTFEDRELYVLLAEQRRNVFQEVANWLATYNGGEQRAAAP